MKTRLGFVSNSSSSSFLIASAPEVDVDKKIKELFAVPPKHPLEALVEDIPGIIENCTEEVFENLDDYLDYIEREGDRPDKDILKYLEKGWIVSIGSFTDEEGGIQSTLCMSDLDYESDDLIIKHEGGY
jgi:hypothetical protein